MKTNFFIKLHVKMTKTHDITGVSQWRLKGTYKYFVATCPINFKKQNSHLHIPKFFKIYNMPINPSFVINLVVRKIN